MKKYALLMTSALGVMVNNIKSFAGDSLVYNLVSKVNDGVLDKPNTGDTNSLLVYGGIIAVVVILLVLINMKGSKNNDDLNNTNNTNEDDSNEN